jgi:hypothetical protein
LGADNSCLAQVLLLIIIAANKPIAIELSNLNLKGSLIKFQKSSFSSRNVVVVTSGLQSERNSYQPNLKELIPFEEAARLSGFTDRHLRKLASEKQLWVVKLGRNWFTTAQAVKNT